MKKAVFSFIAALVIVAVCLMGVKDENDIIRIHILADNDSQQAQDIKLKVRDEVNEFLAPLLINCKTKAQAQSVLNENLNKIREIAELTAQTEASVSLSDENFPKKTYGDKTYPAGRYTALIVRIGKAQGRNWWCVAFPPMCYTSEDDEQKVEYRSIIVTFLERLGII